MSSKTSGTGDDMAKFKKGESGNPGGRPKMSDEARQAFEDMEPEALAELRKLLKSKSEPVRLDAIEVVLERRLGKVVQQTDNTHSTPDGKPVRTLLVEFVDPDDESESDQSDETSDEA